MNQAQFHIGLEFWCDGKRWRCTDVGSRVIVAISLEPHAVVSLTADPHDRSKRTHRAHDPSWLSGPPYGVLEHVFDEHDIQWCSLDSAEDSTIKTLGDLQTLIRETNFDIETYFKELHHFSKPPFKTAPPRFEAFVDYCNTRAEGIDAGGENERTIQRAYAFVRLVRTIPAEECLARTWRTFPLAKASDRSAGSDG